MQVVNGYVCQTSCDAVLAQRNINPADPQDDVHNPKSPNYGKPEDPHHPGKPLPTWEAQAVTLGGSLAEASRTTDVTGPAQAPTPVSKPYAPGSTVSLSV